MKTINIALCILLLAVSGCFAQQNSLTKTTLSAAVSTTSQNYVTVASATGITAGVTSLYVGGELMPVTGVSGTKISVMRVGKPRLHASGAAVLHGRTSYFFTYSPAGTCTLASQYVHPWVDITNETVNYCINSRWQRGTVTNVGTANTSITASEVGDANRKITTLTFSGITVGAAVGAADLAFGYKLYTFPTTGAVVVNSASMNLALLGSGATCDADTPDAGIGTVIASGAVDVLSGTATFEDILTGQTVNDLAGTVEIKTVANQPLAIESAGTKTVHLNVADGWAGACTVTASGTVVLDWSILY